ncbi:hypothetical protein C0J52_23177 [Blattella germanica]|nr:hypothetical protein C0J52_23177 [Blattella germanica]
MEESVDKINIIETAMGVFHQLVPSLREDEDKFKNYFRMSFETHKYLNVVYYVCNNQTAESIQQCKDLLVSELTILEQGVFHNKTKRKTYKINPLKKKEKKAEDSEKQRPKISFLIHKARGTTDLGQTKIKVLILLFLSITMQLAQSATLLTGFEEIRMVCTLGTESREGTWKKAEECWEGQRKRERERETTEPTGIEFDLCNLCYLRVNPRPLLQVRQCILTIDDGVWYDEGKLATRWDSKVPLFVILRGEQRAKYNSAGSCCHSSRRAFQKSGGSNPGILNRVYIQGRRWPINTFDIFPLGLLSDVLDIHKDEKGITSIVVGSLNNINKFTVKEVQRTDIKDFKTWWPNYYKRNCISEETAARNIPRMNKIYFGISSLMHFVYDSQMPGKIVAYNTVNGLVKNTFNEMLPGRRIPVISTNIKYINNTPIKQVKINDIKKLICYIPQEYKELYIDIVNWPTIAEYDNLAYKMTFDVHKFQEKGHMSHKF